MTEENQNPNQDDQKKVDEQQQKQEDAGKDQKPDEKANGGEAKFTQDDLNKFAAKIRAEEKAKADKLKADMEHQAELDKMEENDRLKAEKADVVKELEEMKAKYQYNENRTNAISKLSEAKLDNRLIDVLMSDKSNEEKIKLMADIQKETIDKAIKEAMPSHNPGVQTNNNGFDSETKIKYGFEKFK